MSKKKKISLSIALALCTLIFSVYFIIISLPEDNSSDDDTDNAYLYVDQTAVSSINAFSFFGEDTDLSFEKDNSGVWRYTKNHTLPTNSDLIEHTLEQAEIIVANKIIAERCNKEDRAQYGLDTPSYTLELTTKSEQKRYFFGNIISSKGLYYMQKEGSETVYLVESSYVTNFLYETHDFLTFDTLPSLNSEDIVSITFSKKECNDISVTDKELFNVFSAIKLTEFVDFGSENYGIYGLGESDAVDVSISYVKVSSKETKTVHFKLGLGESKEFIYLLTQNMETGEFSEMVYLFSSPNNDLIYEYISDIK